MISHRRTHRLVLLKVDKESLAPAIRLETKTVQLVPDYLCNHNYTKNLLTNAQYSDDGNNDFELLHCSWIVAG